MDKGDLYLGLAIYGGIVLLALWRSYIKFYLGLKTVDDIEDIHALRIGQFIGFIIWGVVCFVLHYLWVGRTGFKMALCVIGEHVALYFSVKRFICWIMTLISSKMRKLGKQSTEQPKKGIGTDPNSPNLSAEAILSLGDKKDK